MRRSVCLAFACACGTGDNAAEATGGETSASSSAATASGSATMVTATSPTATDGTSEPVDTGASTGTTATTAQDSTDSAADSTGATCEDRCPAPNGGLDWACEHRFAYGLNYAWHHFAGDFGGIPQWGQVGVSEQPDVILAELEAMKDAGVSVIRWWVLPDFRGAGIVLDGTETPTGLGGTIVADLETALELAAQADVYLMPCLFSFDGFRPSHDEAGIWVASLEPIASDAAKRDALLETVVRPIAQTIASHANADRVVAWDVINEPEWAITGPSPYGDMDYTPNSELAAVDHATMESFVADTIAVLRSESDALVTVGGAAMKWAHAWSQVDIDFYQFHIYDWVDDYWPYDMPPSAYDVDDKPVVMGEFPLGALNGVAYGDVVAAWWDLGYAGAMAWQFDGANAQQLDMVRAFADSHPCETAF